MSPVIKDVFPTCVGMNRFLISSEMVVAGIPHLCGDEPSSVPQEQQRIPYSPLVWG